MRGRASVLVAVVCALLAAGGSAGGQGSGAPVYALTGGGGDRMLSPRDPATLREIGPGVPLTQSAGPAGFSPDRSMLAFLSWSGDSAAVLFLDVRRMRWLGGVQLLRRSGTAAVRWIGRRTVLALAEQPDGLRVFVVDAARRRIVARSRIQGHFAERQYVEPTPAGTAVLLAPPSDLGPARLAVVRPSGKVRTITLVQMLEGAREREIRRPALVADPSASRAYVVGGFDEPVAVVDLRTLAVSYHRLGRRSGFPSIRSSDRMAAWLGAGRLALVGFDEAGPTTARLGLTLVDTRTWEARTLDPDADFLSVAGGTLIGGHPDGSFSVFASGGARRFTLSEPGIPPGLSAVASNGRYLYVPGMPDGSALVVDLASGKVVGRPLVIALAELLSPGGPSGLR